MKANIVAPIVDPVYLFKNLVYFIVLILFYHKPILSLGGFDL